MVQTRRSCVIYPFKVVRFHVRLWVALGKQHVLCCRKMEKQTFVLSLFRVCNITFTTDYYPTEYMYNTSPVRP
jgi:hypothetical protein